MVLGEFSDISFRCLPNIRPVSGNGLVMAKALVRDGVLKACNPSPSEWLGAGTKKNKEQASMIVHRMKLASFTIPIVENLAFLVSVHRMHECGLWLPVPIA